MDKAYAHSMMHIYAIFGYSSLMPNKVTTKNNVLSFKNRTHNINGTARTKTYTQATIQTYYVFKYRYMYTHKCIKRKPNVNVDTIDDTIDLVHGNPQRQDTHILYRMQRHGNEQFRGLTATHNSNFNTLRWHLSQNAEHQQI